MARAIVSSQFVDIVAQRFSIAEVAHPYAVEARADYGSCFRILNGLDPFFKGFFTRRGNVVADRSGLDGHILNVAKTLQEIKKTLCTSGPEKRGHTTNPGLKAQDKLVHYTDLA